MVDIVDPFAAPKRPGALAPSAPAAPAIVDPFAAPARPVSAVASFDAAQAPPRPGAAAHSTMGDIGRSALGTAETSAGQSLAGISALGPMINRATGKQVFTKDEVSQQADDAAKSLKATGAATAADVSPEFAEATKPGLTEEGGLTPTNVASKAINTAAAFLPQAAAVGAASFAGPAAALGTGAAVFGAQGIDTGRESEQARIDALSPEQLAAAPRYAELVKSGLTPEAAKAQFTDEAVNRAGLVGGGVGAALGVLPGGKLAEPLERGVTRALAAKIGEGAARTVGAAATEGATFGGINAAGQVVQNAANMVPTGATEGVGEALASGLLPGALMGAGRALVHGGVKTPAAAEAPAPRFPDAAPGSLSDAANAVSEHAPKAAADFMGDSNGNTVEAGRASELATATARAPIPAEPGSLTDAANATPAEAATAPPNVPWINPESGEIRTPTDTEVKDQFHRMFDQAMSEQLGVGAVKADRHLAAEWGMDFKQLKQLRDSALEERRAGVSPDNRTPEQSPDEAQRAADDEGLAALDQTLASKPAAEQPSADATEPTTRSEPATAGRTTVAGSVSDAAKDVAGTADEGRPASVPDSVEADGATAKKPASEPAATEIRSESPTSEGTASARSRDGDAGATDVLPRQPVDAEATPSDTGSVRDGNSGKESAAAAVRGSGDRSEPVRSEVPGAVDIRDAQIKRLTDQQRSGSLSDEGKVELDNLTKAKGDAATSLESNAASAPADERHPGASDDSAWPGSGRNPPDGQSATAGPVDGEVRSGTVSDDAEPAKVETAARESAAHPENNLVEPSPAQQEANNFKQGHVDLHGLDVTIQVPKGGIRRGTTKDGAPWERPASDHYGHVRGTTGADGEQHDVYLGPHADAPDAKVFVIDQTRPGSKIFDEHKSMIGFASGREARASYEKNFPKGMKTFGGIREMSMDEFKAWAKSPESKKPVSDKVQLPVSGKQAKGERRTKAQLAQLFQDKIDAEAKAKETASFRQPSPPAEALDRSGEEHTDAIAKAVRDVVKTWGDNAPRVRVISSAEDLPASVKSNSRYRTAKGVYDQKGTAYIVASNHENVHGALKTLAHEAIGHHGVESILNEHVKGGWNQLATDIDNLRTSGKGSAAMRDALDNVARRYPGADKTTYAQETLAVMAERGIRNGLIDRAIAAVRTYLRKIMPDLKFSEADLRAMLTHSEAHLREGAPIGVRQPVQAMSFDKNADPFYSALNESVGNAKGAPKSANAAQWKQWLDGASRRGEFKNAEREWMGVDQFLDSHKGPITRDDIQSFVRDNQVQLSETTRADENGQDTKFGQYTLPGGKNYREMLLTLPHAADDPQLRKLTDAYRSAVDALADARHFYDEAPFGKRDDGAMRAASKRLQETKSQLDAHASANQAFQSSHFDEPNILAHVRMNDRTGPNGEKILHVEEVQSDWHQAGRRKGYGDANDKAFEKLVAERDKAAVGSRAREALEARVHAMAVNGEKGVPDAPFKKEWPALAMKRVLREAVEKGYDKVTWTTGAQQAERFDLSKQVKSIEWSGSRDGTKMVTLSPHSGNDIEFKVNADGKTASVSGRASGVEFAGKRLDEVVGKDVADKIVADRDGSLSGSGLRVGGEGMKAFYDKMLPNEVNKLVKQWGAKVAPGELSGTGEVALDHSYTGPQYTREAMADFQKLVRSGGGNIDVNPLTSEKVSSPLNRVANEQVVRDVIKEMDRGSSFKEAIEAAGDMITPHSVRELFGGELSSTKRVDDTIAPVHSLDITPAMRESVMQGQPLFDVGDPRTAGLDKAALGDPETVRDAQREWATKGTESKYFKRYFDGSKVVDTHGEPLVVHHGTAAKFSEFSEKHSGGSTEQPGTALGHFFAEDKAVAENYADTAASLRESFGMAAHERVVDAYLAIKKPYEMTGKEYAAIETTAEARALKAKLMREGYDGIRMKDADQWIAFKPDQIKSTENRGTFDPRTNDINFSMPEASMDSLEHVLKQPDEGLAERAKAWLRGKAEDFRPAALGALQRRHVTELMDHHPALKGYGKGIDETVQRLETDRNQLMAGAPDAAEHPNNMLKKGAAPIAEATQKFTNEKGPGGWFGRRKPEAKVLADLMSDATIHGIDPSEPLRPLTFEDSQGKEMQASTKNIIQRVREIRGQMKGRPGDDKSLMMDEVKRLRNLPNRNKSMERTYPDLAARWQRLSPEAKSVYKQQRDWHSQMRDANESALIKRIEAVGRDMASGGAGDLAAKYTRKMTQRIRQQFETARKEGVYFPLSRDGDFWVSFTDKDKAQGFKMFETAHDATQAEKKLRAAGFTIDAQGRRDSEYRAKNAPSGTFVADIIGILKKSGAPEKVQDEIYQTFLKTLPEMSMRKHSIHRRNIPGFSDDVLRVFSKAAFHGSHQLARLRYSHELQAHVDAATMAMDNYRRSDEVGRSAVAGTLDVARGDALLGEIKKRVDFMLSPKDSQLANVANSVGFLYYMGASPASAIVNLTQNAQVTLPALGAVHGWPKASRVLGAAMRDSLRTFGNIDRTLTNPEERRAYNVLRQRGDIDKTQARTLAGLAEGALLQSSPAWSKTMNAIGYMFHKAEVINRESAGMAAYRLSRMAGKSFEEATQYASDTINGTHFDYSASNRPRMMQGNTARIALQFKNYSVGMSWAMYRNLYQAMKGETPEVRRVARRTLTGILGMTGVLAGTMGLPVINALKYGSNAAHALFGDDEPFDFDTEYRGWLADHLGEGAAKVIANGAVNQFGANVAGRVSLSDMWFRDADRQLEGADAYHQMLESLAGPMGGLAKNFFVGSQQVGDGNVWRGIETMMPKFAKDSMKALRFEHEGANTLRGDPILPDVTTPESFIQALGFQPTRLFEQQRENNALKNYEQSILDRRQTLMNAYAMAVRSGDDRDVAMEKIHAFNAQYPEIALKAESIRQSLRARAKYSAEADGGIVLNKKIANRVREAVGVGAAP